MSSRRDFLRTVTGVAAGAFVAKGIAAGAQQPQWSGDSLQWSAPIAEKQMFEVRGVRASIQAIRSHDDRIHVDARRRGPADAPIEVVESESGISLCVGTCGPGNEADRAQNGAHVDFVVQVPPGIRFAASVITGNITVEQPRSAVNAATIDGSIIFELAAGTSAEFFGNTASGRIDSDYPLVLQSGSAPPTPPPFLADRQTAGPRLPPQIIHAVIGSGGPVLRATVVRGDITLLCR